MLCFRCIALAYTQRRCPTCELNALPPFDIDALLARVREAEKLTAEQVRTSAFPARCPVWWRALHGPSVAGMAIALLGILAILVLDPMEHYVLRGLGVMAVIMGGLGGLVVQFYGNPPAFPRSRTSAPRGLRAYLRAMQAGKFALAWEYVLPGARGDHVSRAALDEVDVEEGEFVVDSADALREYWQPLMRKTACGMQSLKLEGFGGSSLEGSLAAATCRVRIQHIHGSPAASFLLRVLVGLLTGVASASSRDYPTRYMWITVVLRKVDRLWYVAQTDYVEVEPDEPM